MFPKPVPALSLNTFAFEQLPPVKPAGFREYNARWLSPNEINLMGVQALGVGIDTLVHELGVRPDIVTGHDFHTFSSSIKLALIAGMEARGLRVKDIGLALSPVAYFGQFALDCLCVAMVTASHNDNGWNGGKMGANRPMIFGPDEMGRLREIVLGGTYLYRDGGAYEFVEGFAQTYLADLKSRAKPLMLKMKVVSACGNGMAGAFAPQLPEVFGLEVIPLDVTPDYAFPRYNPNPENMEMLHAIAHAVKEHGADVGLGCDGDRCGVVDDEGAEIFADKIGVMLARDLGKLLPGATFVVDVKSTGLYLTDAELQVLAVRTDYCKTGHSYIKCRFNELCALAGFKKSGHFLFFNEPIGRGYDNGLPTAIVVIKMLDCNPDETLADLYRALPKI